MTVFTLQISLKSLHVLLKMALTRPSLIDVILTNNSNLFFHHVNFNCGLSDWHNMIATVFKENSTSNKRQKVTFRNYKNFSEADFFHDPQRAPLRIADIFDDVYDSYWVNETLVRGDCG